MTVENVVGGRSGMEPKFLAVDFFCGAGGTTRGLIDAGGYVVAGVDKVAECAETYENNNVNLTLDGAHARYLRRDVFEKSDDYPDGERDELIRDLWELVEPIQGKHPGLPLLFAICAPCQPFTRLTQIQMTEARSTGRTRDRGLLYQSLDYVREFCPEMVLCENVAGIQKEQYGGVWQEFMRELQAMGYVVGSAIVNASRFGIPQNRKRSIMLAIHENALKDGALPEIDGIAQLAVPEEDPSAQPLTVRDVIGHLPPIEAGGRHPEIPNHQSASLSELNRRRLEFLAPGESNAKFSGTDLELECHRKMREKEAAGENPNYSAGFKDVYCRMDPDQPSPAITTKFFATSCGRYGHYDQTRAISIREGAAIQSFPDGYVFYGKSIQQNAKMVGNAVPPRLSEFFAKWMMERTRSFVDNEERILRRARERAAKEERPLAA